MDPLILLEIRSQGVLLPVGLKTLYSELNLIDTSALLKMTPIIKGGITLKNTEWLTKSWPPRFRGIQLAILSSMSFCLPPLLSSFHPNSFPMIIRTGKKKVLKTKRPVVSETYFPRRPTSNSQPYAQTWFPKPLQANLD